MTQNSFPLTKWHEEHMEKLIIRYVTGLPADASNWQKRMNKKYGKQPNIIKNIKYDIKHGANKTQVLALFSRIREESFFQYLQINKESMDRLDNLERELHKSQHIDSLRRDPGIVITTK
ncbi:MAG: hypothetical protein ACRD5B_01310 [Nitrososphaeraceae archaeon]